MKLEIISRNYKVSDHLKNVLENKVEKFSRYFEDDAVMKISLKQIGKDKYGMEITVFFSGNNIVRSEVISDNMYNNIDLALPKIEGQIRKYRTKLGKKIKQSAIDEIPVPAAPEVPSDKIVRKKTFALHKMSVEEAVDYVIPGTAISHRLIRIKKVKKTPEKYPRTFAKIKKNPL